MSNLKIILLIIFFIPFYYLYDYCLNYYYSQPTNKIKFIQVDTVNAKKFNDFLNDSIFKGKVTYIVQSFYIGNPDLKEDFPYFKKLYEKYHHKSFQILYTNDVFRYYFNNEINHDQELQHKIGIRKHQLFGNHTKIPFHFETKEGSFPRHMLIKDGMIVDTFARRPSNYSELCKKIDELLKK